MRRYFAKKIDLEWLTKQIAQFFETRKFEEILASKQGSGYDIIAGSSSKYKIKPDLKVSVRKENEEISVTLELAKEVKKYNYPVMLATLFGGGYFFLKDLKSDESWNKIEREFWQEVNTTVMNARE